MLEVISLFLFGAISFPFVVYFSVKFGTVAYLHAKRRYEEIYKKGDR